MTSEERSRQTAELLRKYGVKLDDSIARHTYQLPAQEEAEMIRKLDERLQKDICTHLYHPSVLAGNWDREQPPSIITSAQYASGPRLVPRDLVDRFEFSVNWEKTRPESFVEYEAQDRDWAEFFGFIRRKPRLIRIWMSREMLDKITQLQRAQAPSIFPIRNCAGIPIEIQETDPTYFTGVNEVILEYDTKRVFAQVTAEQLYTMGGGGWGP